MPELPDIDLYVRALEKRLSGSTLDGLRLKSPFLLRSVAPTVDDVCGRSVVGVKRLGKRIAFELTGEHWLVLHLMIAGRLHWHERPPALTARNRLASFDFQAGSVLLTEAGSKKRASLFIVGGRKALAEHDPGGIEPLHCTFAEFKERLCASNNTLKRALTDPGRFSGIGNAYSDEILHRARLSPAKLTSRLDTTAVRDLFEATRDILSEWTERLMTEAGSEFPTGVTAFKKAMAVHGRYGKPCPVCQQPVQRIRYKSRETNYCAECQTGGKLLADRSLSRLLKDGWPRRL